MFFPCQHDRPLRAVLAIPGGPRSAGDETFQLFNGNLDLMSAVWTSRDKGNAASKAAWRASS